MGWICSSSTLQIIGKIMAKKSIITAQKFKYYGTLAKHQMQCLKCQSQASNLVLTLIDTARSKFTCVYAINLSSFTENLNPCIPSFWSWISILANDLIFSHIKWLKLYMYLILNFLYANDFRTLQLAAHKAFILDYDYSSICEFPLFCSLYLMND